MPDFGKTRADHRHIVEMLSVYIDGELPSRDRIKVEEHLAECADCTWELETLHQTVDLMGQLPKVAVPRAFTIHEAQLPKRVRLFQAKWAYTYLKGATALASAFLILVLVGDAFFQFQRTTAGFAPAMAPAKELAAPTVIARQEVPPASMEAPILPEEALDEAEGVTYGEVMPPPTPSEEPRAFAPMFTPTAPADRGGGEPPAHEDTIASSLATPAPLVGKAEATGTPLPAAAMEAPAVEVPEAPAVLAVSPMATPQPQMTATPIPAAPLVPPSAFPSATPTPLPVATMSTATPVLTATPVSMAKAPAGVRATEEKGALAEPPARPQESPLALLRLIEASLCLLVIALIAATLIVRRRTET